MEVCVCLVCVDNIIHVLYFCLLLYFLYASILSAVFRANLEDKMSCGLQKFLSGILGSPVARE